MLPPDARGMESGWPDCSLHDLIQPSFSFLVGVALPFSMASRLARGQSKAGMTAHAFWRALLLVALGVFLRSRNSDQTNFTFEDTLSQIGLGYPFLFLLGFFSTRVQWIALALILVGDWAAFALYPLPAVRFRLRRGRGAGELALSFHRVRGPLEQEQQPGLGVRYLVLEPVPPQAAVHGQRRRLRDLELHPDAGHDDPGPAGRRSPAPTRVGWAKILWFAVAGGSAWRPAGAWASWASARWSSGSGRRAGCSTAAAGASCSWPASTR